MHLEEPLVKMATATLGQATIVMFCVKLSATSDLKGFQGRDQDEDRESSWVTTLKTAFTRDQAKDGEKCLVFGGLLNGPAQIGTDD